MSAKSSFVSNCLKRLTKLWSFVDESLKLLRFINGHQKILTWGGIIAVAALLVFEVLRGGGDTQAAPNPNPQLTKVDAELTKVDALLQRADRTLDPSPQLTKVDAELAKVDALVQRADRTLARVEPKQDRRGTHVAKRANARAPHSAVTKTKFGNTRAARGPRERELFEWAATSAGRAMRSNTTPRELVEAVTAFRDALE